MRAIPTLTAAWLACSACSGSASTTEADGSASSAVDMDRCGTTSEALALTPSAAPTPVAESPGYVAFVDCATGFRTDEVHDSDREVVHFDANLEAMISAASGESVSGWTALGTDLDWSRSGVSFRVRFGTEAGERRAFFTEAGPGTICNLNVAGPDVLYISATGETPPSP